MQMDDARYSFINYLPSEISNAYGPQVHDPRSGEIIQTRIGWYHNVMELLHEWYMVQAAVIDPRARHATFDTELMGQLIRFVSSHEVGHTLGLRHNMGSSSTVPVDSLRNNQLPRICTATHPALWIMHVSIMWRNRKTVYATKNLLPRIGEYDKWAIEWGYRYQYKFG